MLFAFKIFFLAVLQGITEFLPISSSGHLAICQNLFGINEDSSLLLVVVLHAGTLVAIVIYYFKTLIELLNKEKHKIVILVIIGTIPAGILGVLIKKLGFADAVFSNLFLAGFGLLITASLLKWGMKAKDGEKSIQDLSFKQALIVGLFQAFAIFPGISRAGSTIIGSIIQKLKRSEAATFSFLLAIPAIGGATFLEVTSAILNPDTIGEKIPISLLVFGFIVSAVVGYFSLKILLRSLKKGSLNIYAYYCFSLGTLVIIWQLITLF
jgi:undecaprenyl-diphosphatase